MSDEQPVSLKKRRVSAPVPESDGKVCIVHYSNYGGDSEIRSLTDCSFRSIRKSVSVRQRQSSSALRLDGLCSKVPTEFNQQVHGCHRWCYSNFTNVTKFTDSDDDDDDDDDDDKRNSSYTTARRSGRNTSTTTAADGNTVKCSLFPQDQCIFCGKGRKKVKGCYETLSTCVTERAEMCIKEVAQEKQDFCLLGKITGVDLRAREARYHESCRKSYVRQDRREHHTAGRGKMVETSGQESSSGQKESREAHCNAFRQLCSYIEDSIIEDGNALRLTMLRDKYITFMRETVPDYTTDQFRTHRLKERLISHFGGKLQYWLPTNRSKSELVYASNLDTGEAVHTAFEATASEQRILSDAAAILRRNIEHAHDNLGATPWPPSASYLQHEAKKPPHCLVEFLTLLTAGKPCEQSTERTQRLCRSFAEDICCAATRGKWSVPKHQLLGLTLHHVTGKAEVVTMLHRYGHCMSYTGVLELETAMANQVQQQHSLLPSNISTVASRVVHFCWDNFDLNEETPSGGGTTHTTHGIVIQELESDAETEQHAEYQVPKSKIRSFKADAEGPLPFVRKRNAEPVFSCADEVSTNTSFDFSTDLTRHLWLICRALFNNNCTVPDWSGWLSKMSALENNPIPSTIGYMKPILHAITDCATVKKCITTSMAVTQQLSQEYTLITMDLAAAKIAYDIIWGDTDLHSKVIVNLGPFHTMCSYLGALGKMMSGSGFEDIVVESGLCASGSIDQVMSGKHYNRSVRVHQRMLDALERLLLTSFRNTTETNSDTDSLHEACTLGSEPSAANLEQAGASVNVRNFLIESEKFKVAVRQGQFGKTPQFWLQYCDCVWTLLMFQRAVKENNLDLFIASMRKMCGLLFSADHLNYGRYLPLYYIQLCNLRESHPGAEMLMRDCGFSVARSTVPGCRIPIDQTIEQTVNRSAKTSGGIIGFSRNVGAYHRWCLTRHKRATYAEATFDQLDMADDRMEGHKATRPSAMKRSELEVNQVISTFEHFLNPFQISAEQGQQLFCLSSGKPASPAVANDLLRYTQAGEHAVSEFIQTRLLSRTVKFHERMKKMSLQTFKSMAVQCTMSSSKKKTVEVKAERNLLGSLLVLSQHHKVNLERLFQHPVGPIPWALATADGAPVKTDKSQIMHCIEALGEQHTTSLPESSVHVVDGNALLHAMVHLPETFEGLATSVFNSLPRADTVHFVTDTYLDNSIKQTERLRRGCSSTYLIGGVKTKLPRDFKTFLLSPENKHQLLEFLLTEWQSERYASKLHGRTVFFVRDKDCFCLTSVDGLTVAATQALELVSNQEEADTRIILHCLHAAQQVPDTYGIVVRSPDTDVFVLLLHYSFRIPHQLLFDTGCSSNRRVLDVHKLAKELEPDVCAALPSFHAFTGCDSTSAFVRKGKRVPFKLLCNNQDAVDAFKNLGTTPNSISEAAAKDLEKFVCSMYGKPTFSDIDKLRYETFRSRYEVRTHQTTTCVQNGVDISLLPPCRSSLKKHCQRVNYQAYIWKHAHIPQLELPSPIGCGWKLDQEGHFIVDWIENALPQQFVEVLTESAHRESEVETLEYVEEDEIDNILDAVFDDDIEEQD